MSCPNREVSDRLPLYINWRLPDEERRRVEEHLRSCAACKEELEILARFAATFHVEEAKLVAYSHERSQLKPEEAGLIHAHLTVCPSCRGEEELLREAHRAWVEETPPLEIGRSPRSQRGIGTWRPRLSAGGPRLAWATLALLAGVLLAASYFHRLQTPGPKEAAALPTASRPEAQAVGKARPVPSPDPPEEMRMAALTPRHFTLREVTESWRGEPSPKETTVTLSTEETAFTLAFLIAITTENAIGYDLEIIDQGGRVVAARKDIKSKDILGHFQETFPRDSFVHGDYVLKVKEVHRKSAQTRAQYLFPFKLTIRS